MKFTDTMLGALALAGVLTVVLYAVVMAVFWVIVNLLPIVALAGLLASPALPALKSWRTK